MTRNNRVRPASVLTVLALSLAAACGGKDAQPAANPPAREIQLAPPPAAQPQLNDAPKPEAAPVKAPKAAVAKAPPKPTPVPTPPPEQKVVVTPINPAPAPPPAPSIGVVETGTSLSVHPAARVCTNTHHVGDRVTAVLSEPVAGSNGLVIPSGSAVILRVAESVQSQNSKDNMKLSFEVVSLRVGDDTYEVDGTITQMAQIEKVRAQSTGDQVKKVGAGAAIGALAGQLLGRNTKSTVIGGAVGAAAGAAVAAGTADYDGCVATTGAIAIALNKPLRVRLLPKAGGE